MQMLSHDQNLPKDLRKAFSNRRAGVQPFSVFDLNSRVNGPRNDVGMRDITIEKRLGTASIKQAHQATINGERGVLKALRPTVEKYSEEDFALCGIVTDHLRRDGLPLPKYLLDSLQEVVREESSLTHEASLQADYRQQVDGTTSSGLRISVPRVFEAHKDWAFEELASGSPLAKVADPKEYERASLAAGLSLLSDITSGRRYHADLHDENIFLDTKSSKLTLIDCGAIGKAGTATLDFLKAFRREDAGAIVDILAKNSVKGDLDDENARASLKAKLDKGGKTTLTRAFAR
jgi:predicted unusual protein kinase regulating ubiquinone biosynthesis (AarF/ABC1/UbiB family)